MCRRKRSRPSSRWRLTKNVKRLSSGELGCDSAMGDVEAARLMTNNRAGAAAPLTPEFSALLAIITVKLRGRLASWATPLSRRRGGIETGGFASPPRDGFALVTR